MRAVRRPEYCSTLLVNTASTARVMIPAVWLDRAAFAVHVAGPHPVGKAVIRAVLLTSFRRQIQDSVGGEELFAAAPEARAKDFEATVASSEVWLYLASVQLLAHWLARSAN